MTVSISVSASLPDPMALRQARDSFDMLVEELNEIPGVTGSANFYCGIETLDRSVSLGPFNASPVAEPPPDPASPPSTA